MGAISAQAARWCSQKRDHLTFFSPKASRGMESTGREVETGGRREEGGRSEPCAEAAFLLFYCFVILTPSSNLLSCRLGATFDALM